MRVLSLFMLLSGCGSYEGRLGVWHLEGMEFVAVDCGPYDPEDEPPVSFDAGISSISDEDGPPIWKMGKRIWITRNGLLGFGSNYGYGELDAGGFETDLQVYDEDRSGAHIYVDSIEHTAALVDDLTLDWTITTVETCEEREPGGCDWWEENYPDDCTVTQRYRATWNRETWD